MSETQAMAVWVFLMSAVGALIVGLIAAAVVVWWTRREYPHG